MADERRVGVPHRRAAADEHHAIGELGQDVGGVVLRPDLANRPVLVGEGRDRGDGARTGDDDVPPRHIEEACHIGDILPALVALPGQSAGEPELAAQSYGTHGTNVSHVVLL
jgi:hypothetical protein